MAANLTPPNHVIVVFGANGDLAHRKLLPALFHLALEGLMPQDYRIIGNSRSEMTDDEFRSFARDAASKFCRSSVEVEQWEEFAARLSYVSHEFTPEDSEPVEKAVLRAEEAIEGPERRLYYLAVPPSAFTVIAEGLGKTVLCENARVIVEKPFGHDLASYRELSTIVHAALDESQVYRIDHFLGKETVQNILALRFANGMFEPVWNRQHIDHVQIDVPETLGIGSRGSFYEATGALRDMIVTHLFQVLAFIAMEPPTSFEPRPLTNESLKVFESMMPLRGDEVVRGQFDGYRAERDVAAGSDTETFFACKVCIDNWRWAGVPFYLRTGKRMADASSSVTLAFRDPPREMFRETTEDWFQQDHLVLDLDPDEAISITFLTKIPGPTVELGPARMVFDYDESFGSELIEAYERLLHDAMIGDRTLFTRGDGIERTWEVVQPILDDPSPVRAYQPGSWGPQEAMELIAPRRWRLPERRPRGA